MSQLWNSFKIAFAMYSKIPVPHSNWTKENMRYVMAFFPWIGLIIGIIFAGAYYLTSFLIQQGVPLSSFFITVLLVLIPVAVTGGIHVDGYLDTCDALGSWQEKEKRLEILKDSNSGAFAVLGGIVYFLLACGVFSMVSMETMLPIGLGFVLSRTLSGLSIVAFPMAKGTGLAATFSDSAHKRTVATILSVYLVMLAILYVWICGWVGVAVLAASGLVFWRYHNMSVKNFGGITGDLAGWFLQVCELVLAATAIFASFL